MSKTNDRLSVNFLKRMIVFFYKKSEREGIQFASEFFEHC